MKRIAWTALFGILFLTYYLSSIPGLQVVPLFRQINSALHTFDISLAELAAKLAARMPEQLDPAKTAASRFYQFALANPDIAEFILRKSAHVALFFFITIAFFLLLRQYLRSPFSALFGAAVLGGAVACLDEFYQTFVTSRSGSLIDVFIDLLGVSLAFFFIAFALLITGRASNARS
jgi:VanZ family protein